VCVVLICGTICRVVKIEKNSGDQRCKTTLPKGLTRVTINAPKILRRVDLIQGTIIFGPAVPDLTQRCVTFKRP
jgi:hypothetical protein